MSAPIPSAMVLWGRGHDLEPESPTILGTPTPLLREGGARQAADGLVGTLRGRPVTVCHYDYVVGDARVPFTIVVVDQIRSPADGVALHPIVWLDRGPFRHRPGIEGWHVVELESSSLDRHYKLAVAPGVPDDAVRRLFEPVVVERCVEERDVLFELEGGTMVVALHGVLHLARQLDAILTLVALPASALAAPTPRLLVQGASLDGARVNAPLTIEVAGAQATAIRYVLDGHYLGKATTAPFTWRLAVTAGVHRLKARLDGARGELDATFTVVRGAVPPVPETPAPGTTVHGSDVYVRGSDALTAALARARPGQTIHLADGVYQGRLRVGDYTGAFAVTRSGTPAAPITLVGGRGAVLDGGGTGGHYGLYVHGASWWRFRGFTVADASKGIVSDGGSHDVYDRIEIRDIGAEGLHLRAFSRDDLVTGVRIHATGQKQAQFGEGVYVGSANSNWSTHSGGRPDTSDGDRIVGSQIWDTGAENIDIKEGTSGGTIEGNRLDGVGMSGENHADSLIDVKGSDWRIVGNHGTVSGSSAVLDGIQVHDVYGDWGKGNVFRQNVLAFPRGIGGYGFMLQGTNVVGCGNRVTGARSGRANVRCS